MLKFRNKKNTTFFLPRIYTFLRGWTVELLVVLDPKSPFIQIQFSAKHWQSKHWQFFEIFSKFLKNKFHIYYKNIVFFVNHFYVMSFSRRDQTSVKRTLIDANQMSWFKYILQIPLWLTLWFVKVSRSEALFLLENPLMWPQCGGVTEKAINKRVPFSKMSVNSAFGFCSRSRLKFFKYCWLAPS